MEILFAKKRKFISIPLILILSIFFWPFITLSFTIYFLHKKVSFSPVKYSLMVISILLLIPIGFAWSYGFFSTNPKLTAERSKPTPQVAGIADRTPQKSQTTEDEKEIAEFVRVVDGDTIEVHLNGKKEKIRIIGIDTPEVVDPRVAPECMGKEASEKAKQIFGSQTSLTLEKDPTQQDRDRYNRLLRYVWLNDGTTDYGRLIISLGYASEYTYDLPYRYQSLYKEEQQKAQELKVGLWIDGVCQNDGN